ncbi:TPA: hypothetical protein PBT65_001739 [Staphylococcus aureus]|nr:hypothetical protein [Staphylococcus aureus]
MKKGEVNISFSNHTFNLNLNDGESIDLRLKNENGNIYLGKIENDQKDKIQNKMNGYSNAGLSETVQKDDKENKLEPPEKVGSSINNILNGQSGTLSETKHDRILDNNTNESTEEQSKSNKEIDTSEQLEDLNDKQNDDDFHEDNNDVVKEEEEVSSSKNKYVSLYIDDDTDDEQEEDTSNRNKYAPLYIDDEDEDDE